MTPKEQLLQEIARSPEFLIEKPTPETSQNASSDSFLGWMDEISTQIPQEEWAKIPSDLSKNLDDYL
ncbi:hypothetical protein IQ249_16025 [Lusitaniella coriacea LEGE 07157]|uniref:Uncharacterized protein n=2 Tax=Lusitaniella TaxID=1983104 RepID=A0A8J7DZK3_9CYAN|nr:hypothetical protein [Lusitaniella coriacea]MBE9117408.1 hypothetical protein [Lusitaniella coriacea LEGE 07157]